MSDSSGGACRVAFVAVLVLAACEPTNKVSPEVAAKKYCDEMKIPAQGISCSSVDTNSDGYVTCSLSISQGDKGEPKIQTIQCAALGGNAGGCKP